MTASQQNAAAADDAVELARLRALLADKELLLERYAQQKDRLQEATALLQRCDDELVFDEFDDPCQHALSHDVKAWLSGAAVPTVQTASLAPSKRSDLLACALTWEPDVRLLGNVTAAEIVQVCLGAEAAEAKLSTVLDRAWRVEAKLAAVTEVVRERAMRCEPQDWKLQGESDSRTLRQVEAMLLRPADGERGHHG